MTSPSGPRPPLVPVGTRLRLREEDYKFGIGQLRLRVTEVVRHPEPGWVRIRGIEIQWDDSDGAQRDVVVRAAALTDPARRDG